MKIVRWILLVLYVGYLTQVGLTLLMLPWMPLWSFILLKLPLELTPFLQSPMTRGVVSAFGLLHLLMIVLEFLHAGFQAKRLQEVTQSSSCTE
ncbi:MAG: hypothetical protein GY906_11895 [bacterium]|nr:hypothetical protein [bacterium]